MKFLFLFLGGATAYLTAFASNVGDEALVTAPDRDEASNTVGTTTFERGSDKGDYDVRYNQDTNEVEGFSFSNIGANHSVPVRRVGIGSGPERQFAVQFPQRARQDIVLRVTDIPNEYLSQMMESWFYFFPRKVLPAIQVPTDASNKTNTVVLTTKETVVFNSETHEIVGGVLTENSPIDLGPDRFKRKFADITYSGAGLYFRIDKRGNDPRIANTATVFYKGKICKIPTAKLFDQDPHGAALFQFPTDEGFNEFLKKTCKMSFLAVP